MAPALIISLTLLVKWVYLQLYAYDPLDVVVVVSVAFNDLQKVVVFFPSNRDHTKPTNSSTAVLASGLSLASIHDHHNPEDERVSSVGYLVLAEALKNSKSMQKLTVPMCKLLYLSTHLCWSVILSSVAYATLSFLVSNQKYFPVVKVAVFAGLSLTELNRLMSSIRT